ncbi:MAG: dienelactone hydrolase family protein [Clostridia bacterium]|nr:dienelactone hydrolase family protein [Clostridia bacterium]
MRRGLCLFFALLLVAVLPTFANAEAALKMGDVDGSGVVSAADASVVLRAVVQLDELDEAQRVAADVDGNKSVDAADASKILRYIVKLAPTLELDGSMTQQVFSASEGDLSYWLYTPENAAVGMPLIIYLHGGSGKGSDLDMLVQNNGFPKYLQDGLLGEVPAFVIIPQLSEDSRGWVDIKDSVYGLVDYACKHYLIDSEKISLTGHSMGGTGTWQLALDNPSLFSRIAPLSGSVQTTEENLEALKNLPVRAFVGSEDNIVSPNSSIQFIENLRRINPNAEVTSFSGAGHSDVPALVYLDSEIGLIDWLIG